MVARVRMTVQAAAKKTLVHSNPMLCPTQTPLLGKNAASLSGPFDPRYIAHHTLGEPFRNAGKPVSFKSGVSPHQDGFFGRTEGLYQPQNTPRRRRAQLSCFACSHDNSC